MNNKIIIGVAVAGLSLFGVAGNAQAQHHHHGGSHGHGGHGGHSGHHSGHHHHFGYYGFPFYTSYLGYYGYYQPYWYRSRLYRNPQYSDASMNVAVQNELARRGYYHGPIDGVIGTGTRRAIRAFQHDEGLPLSGWIDGRLLSELRLI